MSKRILTRAEKQAKTLILRHWKWPGQNPLPDSDVCLRICAETGWPPSHKRDRKALMVRYWMEVLSGPATVRKAQPRDDFYHSREWRAVRYEALRLHGARCQCCGVSARDGKVMHVDHIKPRSRHPALALVLANLQILCEDCNLGKMARDETDWRSPTDVETEECLRTLSE